MFDNLRKQYRKSMLHKYSSGKYYSWYTMKTSNTIFPYLMHDKISSKYIAVGTAIASALVKLERITDDINDRTLVYAECKFKKFCMKGGHTYNHVQNARIRKNSKSKRTRQKLKQLHIEFTRNNIHNLMLSMCDIKH